MSVFAVRDLTLRYPDAARDALHAVNMDAARSSLLAVLGPNGSGKSTLLKVLLGALRANHGSVHFLDRPIAEWPRREIARHIGVVPQGEEITFPITVRELVAMGRYPHQRAMQAESAADARAISAALERSECAHLAARDVTTLSGGERQRARIARALAQQPETLVLDEPTTSLDIHHEMEILHLLRELADSGATVILVTHNLNLAARFADRVMLLDEGRVAAEGAPAHVFTPETIGRVYRWPIAVMPHAGPGADTGAPQVVPLRRQES